MATQTERRQVSRLAAPLAAGCWLVLAAAALARAGSPTGGQAAQVCRRELEHANRSVASWGDNMESMVSETKLPATIRDSIHDEANKILDLIEEFGRRAGPGGPPAEQLARDLVAIRRRSNRLALDVYLNTFDMRWPQNSLQLGVIVERVQQACLDRAAIRALESPASPLAELLALRAAGPAAPAHSSP